MPQRDWRFVADCLTDLQTALANLGQPLICKGEAVTVLQTLVRSLMSQVFSHETGNGWTYARDQDAHGARTGHRVA